MAAPRRDFDRGLASHRLLLIVAWPAIGCFATGKGCFATGNAKANTPTMLLAMVSVSVFVASYLRAEATVEKATLCCCW
jgi:hypothetical protein